MNEQLTNSEALTQEFNIDFPAFKQVTTDEQLLECCQKANKSDLVVLDTEFVRVRTFYPQLGLIQLYDGENLSLIDPLTIKDFTPFIELLANTNILKVLHACSEDLEVFAHFFQQLPEPMLDTQVMAQFLNLGNSLGLATLLKKYFQIDMDKGPSRTNWLVRPLTDIQLHYAAADVGYLWPLYGKLRQQLEKTEWLNAAEFDCQRLVNKYKKEKDSDKAYLKIANHWQLEGLALLRLQQLAKWRYEEAIKRDLALNFVIRGEHLYTLAKNNPKHTSELLNLGVSTMGVRIHGKKLLRLLERANKTPEELWPQPIEHINTSPKYRKLVKKLQTQLKEIAPATLPAELIAAKKQVEQLIKWVWLKQESAEKLPVLLQDWRKPYGLKLLDYLKANLKIESND